MGVGASVCDGCWRSGLGGLGFFGGSGDWGWCFTLGSTLVAVAYEDNGFAGEGVEACVFLVEDSGWSCHDCWLCVCL